MIMKPLRILTKYIVGIVFLTPAYLQPAYGAVPSQHTFPAPAAVRQMVFPAATTMARNAQHPVGVGPGK